jgi:hypothetical protein
VSGGPRHLLTKRALARSPRGVPIVQIIQTIAGAVGHRTKAMPEVMNRQR